MNTLENKPDIVQSFDWYKDREYYKVSNGFLFTSNIQVRSDRLDNWNEWNIQCKKLPDKIIVNGEEYKLTLISHRSRDVINK